MSLPSQVSPPQITLSDAAPSTVPDVDVVALPVLAAPLDDRGDGGHAGDAADADAGPSLGPGTAELLDQVDLDPFALLDLHGATGQVGEVVEHAVSLDGATNGASGDAGESAVRLLLLVGVGGGSPTELRRAGAALARRVKGHRAVATSLAALTDDAGLRALVEGLVLGSYEFHRRSTGAQKQPVERVVLAGVSDAAARKAALDRSVAVARAGWLSRTLALVPGNEKSPEWLADQAVSVAREAGLTAKVWDEKQLAAQGFGGILGVGQGSARPPRLVRLDYTPASGARKAKHVVLVGKGITFDTGGLSIKPKDNMMAMKRDMTGAGVVLAVMGALAAVGCPVKVTGLLPLAENSVGANSIRPGDVLVHYGGRTSEVTNTDAEGRLVLADAMAYALDELKPDALVDVATLTGAMKIALGQKTGGYFATDDALADLLRTASLSAGEPLWRMPLVDDYEDRLSSKVADADNAAGPPGAITAALFLRHFAGDVPWAHLDIASVGDAPKDEYEYTKGATGFGARALLHWLELREPLAGVGS